MTAPSLREAAQMALEALDRASATLGRYDIPGTQNWIVGAMQPALESLRAALALRDAEPVAWRIRYRSEPGMVGCYPWSYRERKPRLPIDTAHEIEPIYAAPQPSPVERKPLTPRQIFEIASRAEVCDGYYLQALPFARAIEAAHNIQGAP